MNREYHRWHSPNLGRDMELLVFGHAGTRVVFFPPRLGRFFDYENWGVVHSLRPQIDRGEIQLFCIDSIDAESLYCRCKPPRERINRHESYERYVLDEVLPLTSCMNPNPFASAMGCSLGAYHAANIALRHPHRFGKLVALSGRYDLTQSIEHFHDLFGGYYDDSVYYHTPCHFLPNLRDPRPLDEIRRLQIILAVGEEDPFRDSNHRLSDALRDKGAHPALHFWRGRAHRPAEWRQMAPLYV
ncbi:esterase family protein [Zavarzinella formosa]|uniref:esterase family protein n=1 Tax=Zavarzinella formosa TaxID=360055 RepID=UPI00030AD7D4|nr:alpha/beta hydrolase-fold protein [Zavarzinella formosa]